MILNKQLMGTIDVTYTKAIATGDSTAPTANPKRHHKRLGVVRAAGKISAKTKKMRAAIAAQARTLPLKNHGYIDISPKTSVKTIPNSRFELGAGLVEW